MSNFFQLKDVLLRFQAKVIENYKQTSDELLKSDIDYFALKISDIHKNHPDMSSISADDLINEIERRLKR